MAQTALITGATSGIGLSTARLLSKNGFNLILCGRREERLSKIKEELGAATNVITLAFDVRDKKEVQEKLKNLNIDEIG